MPDPRFDSIIFLIFLGIGIIYLVYILFIAAIFRSSESPEEEERPRYIEPLRSAKRFEKQDRPQPHKPTPPEERENPSQAQGFKVGCMLLLMALPFLVFSCMIM